MKSLLESEYNEKDNNFYNILFVAVFLLYPTKAELDDGGTVIYYAPLYEVHNVHSVASFEKEIYREGTIVEILGFEVFDNVKIQ